MNGHNGVTICADFSADIGDTCPITQTVDNSDFAAFTFGDNTDSVELSFTTEALRTFLKLGSEALAQMDSLLAVEQAAKVERRAASQAQQPVPASVPELVTVGEVLA